MTFLARLRGLSLSPSLFLPADYCHVSCHANVSDISASPYFSYYFCDIVPNRAIVPQNPFDFRPAIATYRITMRSVASLWLCATHVFYDNGKQSPLLVFFFKIQYRSCTVKYYIGRQRCNVIATTMAIVRFFDQFQVDIASERLIRRWFVDLCRRRREFLASYGTRLSCRRVNDGQRNSYTAAVIVKAVLLVPCIMRTPCSHTNAPGSTRGATHVNSVTLSFELSVHVFIRVDSRPLS